MSVVLSATAVATEKESDTWTLLIVSPVSGSAVMWGKFVGVMRRLFWPWTIVLLHFGIFTVAGVVSVWSTLIVIAMTVSANALWVATGLYLSLRLTRVTTAVVVNLLLPITVYALVPLVLATIEYGLDFMRGDDMAELTLYYLPYWYIGEGIDSLSRSQNVHMYALDGGGSIRLPFFDTSLPMLSILFLALAAGVVFIGLTVLIIQWTAWRFDGYVKRAS
jgi:ABC-type transport system involved in multi-copper enzyme maturation permease subunit